MLHPDYDHAEMIWEREHGTYATAISDRPFVDGENYELGSGVPEFDWLPPMDCIPSDWWKAARMWVCDMSEDDDVTGEVPTLKILMLDALAQVAGFNGMPNDNWHVIWSALVLKGQRLNVISE